MTRRVGQ